MIRRAVAWTEGLATALKSTLKKVVVRNLSVERALKGTCSAFSSIC